MEQLPVAFSHKAKFDRGDPQELIMATDMSYSKAGVLAHPTNDGAIFFLPVAVDTLVILRVARTTPD